MSDTALDEGESDAALLLEDRASKHLDPVIHRVDFAAFPEAQLAPLLGESIWELFPWNQLPPGKLDRGTLIQAYNASLERLYSCKQDVSTLLHAACLANLEFRQGHGSTHDDARKKALKAELNAMLARAKWKATPSMSVVDADVASQPALFLRRQLNTALTDAVNDFTAEFRALLDRLMTAKMIGRIAWKPNHCCGYDFFKQVVVQENQGASQSTRVVDAKRPRSRNGQEVIGEEVTTEVRGQGRHLRQREEHEHIVINAVRTSIGNSQVVMPPAVVELTQKVPDWLGPFVQVVDGDLCRETIETHTQKAKAWQDATVTRRPIYGWEPAVIIGPYVLTGWGPREVTAELARREMLPMSTPPQTYRHLVLGLITGLLVGTGVYLYWRAVRGVDPWFGILALVVATRLVWQELFEPEIVLRYPVARIVSVALMILSVIVAIVVIGVAFTGVPLLFLLT